ncbi:MAG: hypothetical protein QXV17_13040 [Candidatus Micrarchaeaceae archaeon]
MFKWLINIFLKDWSDIQNEQKKGDDDYKLILQVGDKTIFMVNIDAALAALIGNKVGNAFKKDGEDGGKSDRKKRT